MENDKSLESSNTPKLSALVRCKPVQRNQLLLRPVDVEKLVGKQHAVRAIWELVGQLDLEAFYAEIGALEGQAGRPVWDPKVLISLWIYAYKDGVNSAREIAGLCEYHPAYQWLTGMEVVNYHTLADFRIDHRRALDQMLIEVLAVLSHQGLVTLKRVMHDGTKIKAAASDKSFRRKATLEAHLKAAQEQVEQMGDPRSEQLSGQRAKARERALREKLDRLKEALKELAELEASRSKELAKAEREGRKRELRVSTTDPQARIMVQAKGAFGPAYNIQISTDAKAKIIVGVGVSQSASDAGELEGAVQRIETNLGQKPEQMVADGAYPTKSTIEAMAEKGIDLIAPLPQARKAGWEDPLKRRGVSEEFYPEAFGYDPSTDHYTCPAGKLLSFETEERQKGWVRRRYRARLADCRSCPFQAQCCPKTKKGRSLVRQEQTAELAAFEAKMHTEQARQIYKERAGVAEFPNAWIKEKMGLRQFRLRGVVKVELESLWACLTYNVCQWTRLCWQPQRLALA
ncbi:MAG: IS1182 family transposase [Candidatus Binatia bacterium]